MKTIHSLKFSILIVGLVFSLSSLLIAEASGLKTLREQQFNLGWKFDRTAAPGAELQSFDDSKWVSVDLPHDFSILDLPGEDSETQIGPFSKATGGYGNSVAHMLGGIGWYRKSFTLDACSQEKIAILKFDGAYMFTEVWVNGVKVGSNVNGYTPFWLDITSHLEAPGCENVLAVKVENLGKNSRWYSGSGIYRNVDLMLLDPVHVNVWGVKIETPVATRAEAEVEFEVEMQNRSENPFKRRTSI